MGKAMLILALGSSMLINFTLHNLNKRDLELNLRAVEHYEGIMSRNIANSGANIAVAQLFRDFTWRTGLDSTDLNSGKVIVTVNDLAFDTTATVSRVAVTSISRYAGRYDTVVVTVSVPPFSRYASFNNKWPTNLYYGTGDTLWGPVHTNQKFGFAGYPVFFGKVTSVAPDYNTLGPTNPEFLGGNEFGIAPITLPTSLPALSDSALAGGDVYLDHVWLRFNPDGSYDFGNDNTYSGGTKYIADYNHTLMTVGNKDIHVEGTISGQLTIYSGRNIYIENDIVYNADPLMNPLAQDMLGLVATKNVIVADTPANQNDVVINAAILAMDKSFKVQNFNSGGPKGTLTTMGSIVQKEVAPYGTIGQVGGVWTITNGFAEKSIYDDRFLAAGPPFFPLVPRLVIYSWYE